MNLVQRATIALAILVSFSTSLVAQAPAWSQPVRYPYAMGGDSGLEGPSATVFNGVVYMVFTSRTPSPSGDYYMYKATSSDGINYSSPTQINTQSGIAHASSNPSLAVYNSHLYLAYNNSVGTNLVSSPDGVNWGTVQQIPTGPPVNFSPSLATDGVTLYIGLKENTVASGLVLCMLTTTSGPSCVSNESTGLNYGPGLANYGGRVIYTAFEWQGNHHSILYYTWQNGFFTTVQSVGSATTSAAPGLTATGLNLLYMGYRANDGGHGLYTTRMLTTGSWDTSYYSGFGIGGPPAMLSGVPNHPNTLYALYAANDSTHYMYATGAIVQ